MRRALISIVAVLCSVVCQAAESKCNDEQHVVAKLPRISHGFVKAVSCANPDGEGGSVRIEITVDGTRRFLATTAYAPSAYVLSLDTTIRFDNGASQGLGVATATGRDATGMHYWEICHQGRTVVDLGEAPSLVPDRFVKNAFSALVSSSGEYQAFRYFYKVKNGKLALDRAIGFNAINSSEYAVELMNSSPSGEMKVVERKKVSLDQASSCMTGTAACF